MNVGKKVSGSHSPPNLNMKVVGGLAPDVPCCGNVPEQQCAGMKKHPHSTRHSLRLSRRGSKSMSIDREEHKEEMKSTKTIK